MSVRLTWLGDSGAVAIWVAGTLAVFIGVIALSFDLGRSATTDTELKWASDAAALAGARQLDGLSGAITRATEAAIGAAGVGLTSNSDTFSNNSGPIKVVNVKFLSKLGPAEGTAGDVEATNDADAHFIQVVVEQKTVNNLLIEVVGGSATSSVQESSVAGYGAALCQVPPLFVCNPDETTSNKTVNLPAGMGILAKYPQGGPNAVPGPGNYGYLQVPGPNGISNIRDTFAAKNGSPVCFDARSDDTQPGNAVTVNDGINVRFDIYRGSLKTTDASIGPPAKNVVSGWVDKHGPDTPCDPGSKNVADIYTGGSDTTAEMMPYPRDKCFYTGACTQYGVPPFDGTHWDRNTYCTVNHPTGPGCPALVTGAKETITRYGMYRAEIEQDKLPNNAPDPGKTGQGELHSCYKAQTWSGIPAGPDVREVGFDPAGGNLDRRVIATAVVNCSDQAAALQGRKNVKIAKWYLMFLVEPAGYLGEVQKTSPLFPPGSTAATDPFFFDNQNLFLEAIRAIDLDQDKAIAHEIVQLYR